MHDNESKDNESRKFAQKWLQDIRFESWLKMVPNDERQFRCSVCSLNASCDGGVSNVLRHAEKSEHIQNCQKLGIKYLDQLQPEEIYESKISFKNRVKSAEADYVRLICETNTPFHSAPKFLHFFQNVDPAILKAMTAGATKVFAITRNFLGPCEESRIIEILRVTKFTVFTDETTDPNSSVKWMKFLVKFVDPATLEIEIGLPRLIKVDSTQLNARGLFDVFKKYTIYNQIPFSNILSISCDNAAVMVGHIKSFKTLIRQQNPSILLIPCDCHKLALVAKDACKKIPLYIENLLNSIVHHMKSARRSEAFAQISLSLQETSLKILDYAVTRWLGRHDCIERVLEMYDSHLDYFRELCVSERNKIFEEIKNQLFDKKTKAYLTFLRNILSEFNKLNSFFQDSETRVHRLHDKCLQFLRIVASNFLKPARLFWAFTR